MGKIIKCTCGERFIKSDFDDDSTMCHNCECKKSEIIDKIEKQAEKEDQMLIKEIEGFQLIKEDKGDYTIKKNIKTCEIWYVNLKFNDSDNSIELHVNVTLVYEKSINKIIKEIETAKSIKKQFEELIK